MKSDEKEIILSYNRLMALQKNTTTLDMSLTEIHEYLFKNLREYAGKIRTSNLWKNHMFERPDNLNKMLSDCLKTLQRHIETVHDTSEFYELLAMDYSKLNNLHPFLDGNGRAQREFLRQQLAKQNMVINLNCTSYSDMLYASKAGCHKDYRPFMRIFKNCICENPNKFESVNSYYNRLPYLAILSHDDTPLSMEQLIVTHQQYNTQKENSPYEN